MTTRDHVTIGADISAQIEWKLTLKGFPGVLLPETKSEKLCIGRAADGRYVIVWGSAWGPDGDPVPSEDRFASGDPNGVRWCGTLEKALSAALEVVETHEQERKIPRVLAKRAKWCIQNWECIRDWGGRGPYSEDLRTGAEGLIVADAPMRIRWRAGKAWGIVGVESHGSESVSIEPVALDGGSGFPAPFLVALLDFATGCDRWRRTAEALHRKRVHPWRVETRVGMSGAMDIRLFEFPPRLERWDFGRRVAALHISRSGRMNRTTTVRWSDLPPLLASYAEAWAAMDCPLPERTIWGRTPLAFRFPAFAEAENVDFEVIERRVSPCEFRAPGEPSGFIDAGTTPAEKREDSI